MATVGLDFGTHQTKICIEDRTDKNRPRYTFFTFKDLHGNESWMLPSIVQVNKDHTISYGFVDESLCEVCFPFAGLEKPTLAEIMEPQLILPERPKVKKRPVKPQEGPKDWKDVLSEAFGKTKQKSFSEQQWEKSCVKIDLENEKALASWQQMCISMRKQFEEKKSRYDSQLAENERRIREWESKKTEKQKQLFRYFKQATFSTRDWPFEISPELLSVWYLTFVLFELNERIGTDYATQMGIPSGYENYDQKKKKAVSLLLSAFNLIDFFDNDKQKFLSAKVEDLQEITVLLPFSQEKKDEYGILVFPESVAILRSLTSNNRLENGMNLLIDIGGGTTDLSFFTIDKKKVEERKDPLSIYYYESLPKGINYIVESATNGVFIFDRHLSLNSKELDEDSLNDAKQKYRFEVSNSCKRLLREIWNAYKNSGQSPSKFNEALKDRPLVYSGGGSTFKGMCNEIETFTSVKTFDGGYLKHLFIDGFSQLEEKRLFPILAVSLGLSVEQINDDILVCPINELFAHLVNASKEIQHQCEIGYYVDD